MFQNSVYLQTSGSSKKRYMKKSVLLILSVPVAQKPEKMNKIKYNKNHKQNN